MDGPDFFATEPGHAAAIAGFEREARWEADCLLAPAMDAALAAITSRVARAAPALDLLRELAAAGLTVSYCCRTQRLLVGPGSRVTPELAERIRRHRDVLVDVVD